MLKLGAVQNVNYSKIQETAVKDAYGKFLHINTVYSALFYSFFNTFNTHILLPLILKNNKLKYCHIPLE